MVDVPAESNVVAFDVRRCPVAEYLSAQGLSELCVEAWCNLDVPLASKWGARLERTGTLAQGAERCDFRWHLEVVPPRR
jgi:ubiquinone biosynthesis protein